jgi:hypothetical protein
MPILFGIVPIFKHYGVSIFSLYAFFASWPRRAKKKKAECMAGEEIHSVIFINLV